MGLSFHILKEIFDVFTCKEGFRQKRTKHSRGWLVIQRSGAEIEQRLKDLAIDSG